MVFVVNNLIGTKGIFQTIWAYTPAWLIISSLLKLRHLADTAFLCQIDGLTLPLAFRAQYFQIRIRSFLWRKFKPYKDKDYCIWMHSIELINKVTIGLMGTICFFTFLRGMGLMCIQFDYWLIIAILICFALCWIIYFYIREVAWFKPGSTFWMKGISLRQFGRNIANNRLILIGLDWSIGIVIALSVNELFDNDFR